MGRAILPSTACSAVAQNDGFILALAVYAHAECKEPEHGRVCALAYVGEGARTFQPLQK